MVCKLDNQSTFITIALCRSWRTSYFKMPNFDKSFLCGFSSRVSKLLRRVVWTPQESRKKKKRKNGRGKLWEKSKKGEGSVCESQDQSQKNRLDKCNNIWFLHFFANTPLQQKCGVEVWKKGILLIFLVFTKEFWSKTEKWPEKLRKYAPTKESSGSSESSVSSESLWSSGSSFLFL